MKDRIQAFLQSENKSSAQFAEEIGVQPSGISHILSGRNNPSLDFVIKMLHRYPTLSHEWLLFGRGPMYRQVSQPSLFEEGLTGVQGVISYGNESPGTVPADKPAASAGTTSEGSRDQVGAAGPDGLHDLAAAAIAGAEGLHSQAAYAGKSSEDRRDQAATAGTEGPHSQAATSRPTGVEPGGSERKLTRIVLFYSDKTFTEYTSS